MWISPFNQEKALVGAFSVSVKSSRRHVFIYFYLYLLSSYCLHPGPLKHILTSVNNDLLNIFIALENPIKKGVIKSFFGAYWTFSAFTWRKHISIMNNDLESWHRLYVHNFEFLGFEQLQKQNMFPGWKYRKVEGSRVYERDNMIEVRQL